MLLATLTDENLESAVMFLAAQPAVCLVNVVFSMEMKFGGMAGQAELYIVRRKRRGTVITRMCSVCAWLKKKVQRKGGAHHTFLA